MVGDDEELRGVGEGRILGIPAGIGMAVRADDRQVPDLRIERPRETPCGGIKRKKAIRIQKCHVLLSLSILES